MIEDISPNQAIMIGNAIGVDWQAVDLEQFRRGILVELEHGTRDPQTNVTNDNLILSGKIALAHLKELPDYYTRLYIMEHGQNSTLATTLPKTHNLFWFGLLTGAVSAGLAAAIMAGATKKSIQK